MSGSKNENDGGATRSFFSNMKSAWKSTRSDGDGEGSDPEDGKIPASWKGGDHQDAEDNSEWVLPKGDPPAHADAVREETAGTEDTAT